MSHFHSPPAPRSFDSESLRLDELRRAGDRGFSLVVALVVLAALAILAGVAVPRFINVTMEATKPAEKTTAVATSSDSRETDPAVSTLAACQAGCRDQYGGSGSAGFDACMRGCGAGGAAGVLREEACSGDVAPGCEAPTTPVCKNGKWICIGPATTGTSVAPTPPPSPQPTPRPTPAPTQESSSAEFAPVRERAPKTVNVSIQGFAFSPATLTIKEGDTVIFKNFDSVGHTATAQGSPPGEGGFDTGLLAQGESKSIALSQKGTFNYLCTPHPNMTGTIVVE